MKLEDLYASTVERIMMQSKRRSSLAFQILVWIIYAIKPLSIGDLQYAIATCPENNPFDPQALVEEQTIIAVCCGLIHVDNLSKMVRLIREWIPLPISGPIFPQCDDLQITPLRMLFNRS